MADRPVRLLVVGSRWPPETFIARLVRGLLDRGVVVLYGSAERPEQAWLQHPGFHWIHTPGWKGSALQRLRNLLFFFLRALVTDPGALIRLYPEVRPGGGLRFQAVRWLLVLPFIGRRYDVIYFPWNSAAVEHLPLFASGKPVVVSCRGSQVHVAPHNPKRREFTLGMAESFRRAAAVHCVSEAIFREAARLGLEEQKAHVIYPAVDPEFFVPGKRSSRGKEVFRIVSTGSLIWTKGYEYAIQAFSILRARGVPAEIHLVGDGPERQRILFAAEDLGIQSSVILHGRVPPERVRELLQGADAFLLSSLSEGVSNAVLEAMACGLPVVTTDVGGMTEAVTDGVDGFLVPPRNPAAAAAALEEIFNDPSRSARIGTAARARIVRDFSISRQIDLFLKLFSEAAGGL